MCEGWVPVGVVLWGAGVAFLLGIVVAAFLIGRQCGPEDSNG